MSRPMNNLPPALPAPAARRLLGIHPGTFARLERAGVFRRLGRGLETATLLSNYFRAIEIEAKAQAQIAAIHADTKRKLAALGTEEPTPSTDRNSTLPIRLIVPSTLNLGIAKWQL